MTEVNRVDGVQTANQTAVKPQKLFLVAKAEAEKAKAQTNDEIQKELFKNKEAQKARKAELQQQYQEELGLSKRQAKKLAKQEVKTELTEEIVDKTTVFNNKEEYKQAVEADKENKDLYTYVKSKKVRKMVDEHKDQFYDQDGNFSSEKYKRTVTKWTGEDYELNLDERRAGAKDYGVKARDMKKAAKYSNHEIEADDTTLKRIGYVAGTTAAGAAVGAGAGALVGKFVNKGVSGAASATGSDFVKVPIKGGGFVDVAVDTLVQVTTGGKVNVGPKAGALIGAAAGGAAGLSIGLATMHKIKDNGKKDIFNGISAEEIIKNGSEGVDGKVNKKIVDSIIGLENVSNEEKAMLLKKAYGENTGKVVNQRELIAGYQALKGRNVPPAEEIEEEPAEEPVEEPIDDCPKTPSQEEKVTEKEVPVQQYKPNKGEYWAGIISDKYGIKGKELTEAVHELKRQHGITNFNENVQPNVLNLPEELVGHKLNAKAEVKEKTEEFAPAKKYSGTYTNPRTQEKSTVYFYTDCNGQRSQAYSSPAERDSAMDNDKVKKAA